jgi:hydrogenase maturation protease
VPVRHRGRALSRPQARLAIVGIGNPLAGDDGVGCEVVRRLQIVHAESPGLWLGTLSGDLFAVADLLGSAERFIFVDAVVREPPGQLVIDEAPPSGAAPAPSLHQTSIVEVMRRLEALRLVDPFPRWSLWGVTIRPPTELHEGLSQAVASAAATLCARLSALVRQSGGSATLSS